MFTQIPAWTFANTSKDWYSLAAALVLAGLENKWVKLSADTQRAILGGNRIGKQSVGIYAIGCWIASSDCRTEGHSVRRRLCTGQLRNGLSGWMIWSFS